MQNTTASTPKLGTQLYTVRDLTADGHFADTMKRVAELLVFTYHNHHQEFDRRMEGKYARNVLFERTDPELVQAQLDTGWAQKAGAPALDYWRQYGERTPTGS